MLAMIELLRSLAIHQARFYQSFLESWGKEPDLALVESAFEALLHDGLWLTKLPLLWTPAYGLLQLDALNKSWPYGPRDPETVKAAALEIAALRPRVDADIVRLILKLKPADLEARVELFYGGRAMNKPLWQYLIAWLEHGAVLRGRLVGPGMLETAFS